jgi:hypothetical protein
VHALRVRSINYRSLSDHAEPATAEGSVAAAPPCELGRVHVDVPSPMVVGGLGGQVRVDLTTLALFDLVGSADVTVPVMTMTP